MCQFCVEHGEGKRWYLQVSNYAHDLESDLRRRGYIVDFIKGFETMRSTALTWADRLDRLPAPLSHAGRSLISAHQRKNHFGQPVPIEECEQIFEFATSITAIPCICRMHANGGKGDEVCLLVTTQPMESILAEGFSGYSEGPDIDDFHRLDKQQAMSLLRQCEASGLMHSIWTFQTPFTAAICNCNIESGCMAMRMTAVHNIKVMWRGEWVARLDPDRCTSCGRCVRACPFTAIERDGRAVRVRTMDCWGCGVCRSACPSAALSLLDRREVPAVAQQW